VRRAAVRCATVPHVHGVGAEGAYRRRGSTVRVPRAHWLRWRTSLVVDVVACRDCGLSTRRASHTSQRSCRAIARVVSSSVTSRVVCVLCRSATWRRCHLRHWP
jgi:hypothetical protein